MDSIIRTITGDILAGELGVCQPHEHIFVRPTPASAKNPLLCIDNFELSLRELESYRANGGGAIVDAQPVNAGRDAKALKSMSEKSGVKIIATTGYHLKDFYSPESCIFSATVQELAELFCDEIRVGLDGDPANGRAGIVKAAIGDGGADEYYKPLLRAAATAAQSMGVSLLLHTQSGKCALQALDVCQSAGLPPERVLICHAERTITPKSEKVMTEVLNEGAYLENDTIGRFKYHDDQSECELICRLIERGFADKLLLSMDTTAERLASYGGSTGLNYIADTFLPLLRTYGVPESTIQGFRIKNPAQALAMRAV